METLQNMGAFASRTPPVPLSRRSTGFNFDFQGFCRGHFDDFDAFS
jgi:hypothetical protein